jgi:hypothetical protein
MKKFILFVFLLIITSKSYSLDHNSFSKIQFVIDDGVSGSLLSADNSSDDSKNIKKINNPFKNTDWEWFTEKYRAERVIMSVGIISIAIGFPIFMVGLFEYIFPQADKSVISDNTFISLMGVGSGVAAVGITLTIVGAVRLNYLKTRDKIEISMSFDL